MELGQKQLDLGQSDKMGKNGGENKIGTTSL